LAWAGLDTVAPTAAEEAVALRARTDLLTTRLRDLDASVATERAALRGLRVAVRSLGVHADSRPLQRERRAELDSRDTALEALRRERAAIVAELEAHRDFLDRPHVAEAPDAHLREVHLPDAVEQDRHTAFLRIWAAISIPVLILGIAVLLVRPSPLLFSGFTTFLVAFAAVEAVARRRLRLFLLLGAAVALWIFAVAGLVFSLLRNWQPALAVLLALTALVLLVVNMGELRGPSRRRDFSSGGGEADLHPSDLDLQG
jgi:hypothetical protein